MHTRRLSCFFLGLWLGGALLVAWAAADTFRAVDRLLSAPHPEFAQKMKALGPATTRAILRYQVSEQNRTLFRNWESVQIVGGLLFFFYLLFGTKEKKFALAAVLLMVIVTLVQRFLMTPHLIDVGRNLDFISPEAELPERNQFWMLHSAYTGVEALKWGIGMVLTARNVWPRLADRSDDARDEFDLIDKTNHRHINR